MVFPVEAGDKGPFSVMVWTNTADSVIRGNKTERELLCLKIMEAGMCGLSKGKIQIINLRYI